MTSNDSSLEKELKKFRVLYDLAIAMTAERTLEENLLLVVERSRELLGTDTAYIALRDESRDDVYMHTLSGIRTEAFKKIRLPFGKGLGGLVAKTRQGFIVEDYLADRDIEHVVDRVVIEEGVVSGMAVPVQMGPKNLGVLYVFNRKKTPFSHTDLDTLFLIGNLAAVEISRQEAEKEVRRSHEELETRVRERTLELRQTNQLLTQEIQERRRSEEDLKESEKRYRELFENVSDFIYTHDLEGRFVEVNAAFRRAYGIAPGETKCLYVRDMVPQSNRALFEEYLKRIREKGWDEGFLKILTRGGKKLILEYKNSLVRDPEGRSVGVRGSARDVTERIRAERERKKLEAQLMNAQRIEAIGTLAGGIAHNFNNLLMGIQGNATLARMDAAPSSPLSQGLENIEKLVRSGAKLTSQLLGYAREGRYEVRPVNLNQLVRDTAGAFSQARKDIVVHQDLAEDLMGVEADQGQIEQVLLNLLVNAADAMPLGGKIFLRTRNVGHEEIQAETYKPKPGQYVELQVQDTGTGMDEKTMKRIFEPFFTTKGLGKGTGLGLSSVYGIVKGHGGYVDVSSRKGAGSNFTVHLPAVQRGVWKTEKDSGPISMGQGTVLLVDDEEVILDVGRQMIEVLGYRVLAVTSGTEALKAYQRDPAAIDLVVLDMIMPDLGGGETFDRLRQIHPGVKVLLSSGYSVDGQAKEILDRGCSGFIQKPFRIQDLSQALRRILGSGRWQETSRE